MDSLALQLKEEIHRALADVENQKNAVVADREALAAEKANMMQLAAVSANDLVELNVGGEHITTTRETLTFAKGSMLAFMFSGRWEYKLTLDKDGRVFLNLNPYAVRKVLDYMCLRLRAEEGAYLPGPDIAADMRAEFDAVVDYLGLGEVLGPSFSSVPSVPFLRPPRRKRRLPLDISTTGKRSAEDDAAPPAKRPAVELSQEEAVVQVVKNVTVHMGRMVIKMQDLKNSHDLLEKRVKRVEELREGGPDLQMIHTTLNELRENLANVTSILGREDGPQDGEPSLTTLLGTFKEEKYSANTNANVQITTVLPSGRGRPLPLRRFS